MNIDLERKVIEKFVLKDKRARYLAFISSSKTRTKFIRQLTHFKDFKSEMFEDVPAKESDFIKHRIKNISGSKTHCYVISDNFAIDQQEMIIDDALDVTIGCGSTILVFGEAEMIYYEGEPPRNRLLSRLKPVTSIQ